MTVFNEDNIVAGDLVKVELDPEVFKMMHKAAGLWTDSLSLVNQCAYYVLASHVCFLFCGIIYPSLPVYSSSIKLQ